MLRFHLDEHVDPAIALGLRSRGIDVSTTADAGLSGAADEAHLAYCLESNRVVVTHDRDFLRWHHQGTPHAGIVFIAQQSRTIGEITRFLALMSQCLIDEDMKSQVEFG